MENTKTTESGAAILDDVAAFIRRHLVCDYMTETGRMSEPINFLSQESPQLTRLLTE